MDLLSLSASKRPLTCGCYWCFWLLVKNLLSLFASWRPLTCGYYWCFWLPVKILLSLFALSRTLTSCCYWCFCRPAAAPVYFSDTPLSGVYFLLACSLFDTCGKFSWPEKKSQNHDIRSIRMWYDGQVQRPCDLDKICMKIKQN